MVFLLHCYLLLVLFTRVYEGFYVSYMKGNMSDSFEARNGVSQGCTIAPVLYLYLCAVFEDWHQQCSQVSMSFHYSH